MTAKIFLSLGALNAAIAVMLGAFGAHGLKNRVDAKALTTWATAVDYHFYHALGLILIGLAAHQFVASSGLKWSGFLMLTGIILFSGSLYLLTLTGVRWLGAITPFGGVAFIISWLILVVAFWKPGH